MERSKLRFYKEKDGNETWWVDSERIGEFLFSFDKKKVYNLFADYPEKLAFDEWLVFNEENEYWMMFKADDNLKYAMKHIDELEERGKLGVLDKLMAVRHKSSRFDDDEEQTNNRKNTASHGGHGNTRIPYGLCQREGIEIQDGWTPRDAWEALEGKGYSASDAYKELKETGKVSTPRKEPEKPKMDMKQALKIVDSYKKGKREIKKLEKELINNENTIADQLKTQITYQRYVDSEKKKMQELVDKSGSIDKMSDGQRREYDWRMASIKTWEGYVSRAKEEYTKALERRSEINNRLEELKGGEEYKQAVDTLLSEHPYAEKVKNYRGIEEEYRKVRKQLRDLDSDIQTENDRIEFTQRMLDRAKERGSDDLTEFYEKRMEICRKKLEELKVSRESIAGVVTEGDRALEEEKGDAKEKEWKTIYDLSIERDTVQDGPYTDFIGIANDLRHDKVKYLNPIKYAVTPSEEDIILDIGGKDKTTGSCASLTFAYLANKAGYRVIDFRGGSSQKGFSYYFNDIVKKLGGFYERSERELDASMKMLENVEEGKEYAFACGRHAAVVRRVDGKLQYLELQSYEEDNRWHDLTETELQKRFKCAVKRTAHYGTCCLIEADKLVANQEFVSMMGYINTEEDKQKKGEGGGKK